MKYLCSGIGSKQLMALTGLAWCGFVLTHMAGNLLILVGPDAYNKYSHALISNPAIYLAEGLLILTLLVHIVKGIRVTITNRGARNSKYAMAPSGAKAPRPNSKYMIFHGSFILAFIIWHLITFKYGTHYETTIDGVVMRDLHRLVIEVFNQPLYVAGYCVSMVIVGLHLSHGFYSAFASLGAFHPKYSPLLSKAGYVYSVVVALGFLAQPIYVFMGSR